MNENVYVCYDGKWGRRVLGKSINLGLFKIVRFTPWGAEELGEITKVFPIKIEMRWVSPYIRVTGYGGWVRAGKRLMKWYGLPGDWHSVVPRKMIDDYLKDRPK